MIEVETKLAIDKTNPTGWKFYIYPDGSMGIAPLNDRKIHEYRHDCHCSPVRSIEDGREFYSHRTYDGRETEEVQALRGYPLERGH